MPTELSTANAPTTAENRQMWSTGIIVTYRGPGMWSAAAEMHSGGFCDPAALSGTLRSTYRGELDDVVGFVVAGLERLAVELVGPRVYVEGDGHPVRWVRRGRTVLLTT